MRFLFAALLASFASAQTTWIVDDTPGPGVAFTSLPAAVAAAGSGDTLLVGPGHYAPFHISGKVLTILGDGNVTTFIDGPPILGPDYVKITAPPVGTTFRLSGFKIVRNLPTSPGPVFANRLQISGAGVSMAGSVVLTDVISEPATTTGSPGGIGLTVTGIAVHASRCVFRGGFVGGISWFGATGAIVDGGALFVADACLIRGGSAISPNAENNFLTAGHGLTVLDATAHLTRTNLAGGVAGISGFPAGLLQANGGAGLRAAGNASVRAYGSAANSIRGGDAGIGGSAFAGAGIEAVSPANASTYGAIVVSGGAGVFGGIIGPATTGSGQTQLGLPPRPVLSLTGSALTGGDLQATQPVTLSLAAPAMASQLFALLIDLEPGYSLLPGISTEPLLLTAPAVGHVGLLDAAGQFAVTFVPATQAPATTNHHFHVQAFAFDPSLGIWLGSNAEVRRIR